MPERDANIERLFHLVMETNANTASIRSDISVLTTKVDDFSSRLKKLEEKEERHVDKEERLNILAQTLSATLDGINRSIVKSDEAVIDIDDRVTLLETDVTKIKNNWGWLAAIVSAVSSVAAFLINAAIHFFGGQ